MPDSLPGRALQDYIGLSVREDVGGQKGKHSFRTKACQTKEVRYTRTQ